jgi:muramidase (phage lysozyme)
MLTRPQAVGLSAAVLAVLVVQWLRYQDEQTQDAGFLAWLFQADQAFSMLTDNTPQTTAERNKRAFLQMIRTAEGTAGPNGYRTLFGGALFNSYQDHPRRAVQFTNQDGKRLWTSAAGAYQFMAVSPLPGGKSTKVNTWDRIRDKLGLADFSPASQDAAALELIREAGALADVVAGRFDSAVNKVRGIWASMPGAGYAQREADLADLRGVFVASGGVLA